MKQRAFVPGQDRKHPILKGGQWDVEDKSDGKSDQQRRKDPQEPGKAAGHSAKVLKACIEDNGEADQEHENTDIFVIEFQTDFPLYVVESNITKNAEPVNGASSAGFARKRPGRTGSDKKGFHVCGLPEHFPDVYFS